jgi:Tol biopolymer transport system component
VYYSGVVDGARGIYLVPADGSSRRPTLILATDSIAVPTSISPDGKTLLYYQRQQIQVLPLPADGQPAKPHPLHEAPAAELAAQFSPDGHWVAYVSVESTQNEVYVLPYPGPGPKIRVSLEGGASPRWSKDGHELLYWAGIPTARLMTVDIATTPSFRAGQPKELFKQLSTTTWDVSPDRNKFLVELSARASGTTLAIVTNWFEELRRRVPAK